MAKRGQQTDGARPRLVRHTSPEGNLTFLVEWHVGDEIVEATFYGREEAEDLLRRITEQEDATARLERLGVDTEELREARAHRGRIIERTADDGTMVYVVCWREYDEDRETGYADEDLRELVVRDRADAEALLAAIRASGRDVRKPQRTGLEEWADDDPKERGGLPKNPWAERAAEERKHLPAGSGLRGAGDVKGSARVDRHGGDFAATGTQGYDDTGNSNRDPDVGTPKEWWRKRWPLRTGYYRPLELFNGVKHAEAWTMTKYELERDEERHARDLATAAEQRAAEQEFGTHVRRDRGGMIGPDGLVDLDTLPPTTRVYGSRRRPDPAPEDLPDDVLAAWTRELIREDRARQAAEARAARDAEAVCETPECETPGPLRRGRCNPCRMYHKRHKVYPPADVIQRRKMRREAPLTR